MPWRCARSSASAIWPAHVERLGERQRPPREPLGQRLALEPLHDQEVDAVLVADVVERADVRVIERRDRARLALEARAPIRRRAANSWRQDLDGHSPVQPRVAGAVDLAHAARAERPDDLVRPEAGAWVERQGHGCANVFSMNALALRSSSSGSAPEARAT